MLEGYQPLPVLVGEWYGVARLAHVPVSRVELLQVITSSVDKPHQYGIDTLWLYSIVFINPYRLA